MDVQSIIQRALPIIQHHPEISKAELFGSFTKGTQREDSDLDILIQVLPDTNFSC